MDMKKIILAFALILGLGLNSMAQTRVWTLKECIEHAIENVKEALRDGAIHARA